MSHIENLSIPFKRRDKRDLSLSRIANFDPNVNMRTDIFYKPSFRKKKHYKSEFASNLLKEILPNIPPKIKNDNFNETSPFRKKSSSNCVIKSRNNSITKQSLLNLEEITELNNTKKIVKTYEKQCRKQHQAEANQKMISNFLTPSNSFISSEFCLTMNEYDRLTTNIKKKMNYPPKIPVIKKCFQIDVNQNIPHHSRHNSYSNTEFNKSRS